jgi:hypothetical protein
MRTRDIDDESDKNAKKKNTLGVDLKFDKSGKKSSRGRKSSTKPKLSTRY